MLKVMRSHKFFSVFLLGFLTIAITIVFVFWGIGPQQSTTDVVVARVNKSRITLAEYERAYEMAYRRAREVYKDAEEIEKLNLRKTVLDELIDNMVLLYAVESVGITVTDDELQKIIMNEPAFQRDGVFDKDVYMRRLSLGRMTPGMFEYELRNDLLLNKMRRLIGETSELADNEAKILDSIKGDDSQLIENFLFAKRELAVKAYVQGLKRQMDISVNEKYTSF